MCYNLVMLKRKTGHTLKIAGFVAVLSLLAFPLADFSSVDAAENNVTFNVNVKDYLSVSITEPASWATANIDTFMCNTVEISASTNSSSGFVVGMTSSTTNTTLTNSTVSSNNTIPTLTGSVDYTSFPNDSWGYGTTSCSSGNFAGVPASTGTPARVLYSSGRTGSGNVYFGAKASSSKASGTYKGTVVFSVVSGTNTINTNPTNPATPNSTTNTAVYNAAPTGGANGTTTYTYKTNSNRTTTTQVSDGNNTSSYPEGYTPPQGVHEVSSPATTTASINEGSPLAAGLAVTAAAAATSGTIFFIIAKRKKDDDEEEDAEES